MYCLTFQIQNPVNCVNKKKIYAGEAFGIKSFPTCYNLTTRLSKQLHTVTKTHKIDKLFI